MQWNGGIAWNLFDSICRLVDCILSSNNVSFHDPIESSMAPRKRATSPPPRPSKPRNPKLRRSRENVLAGPEFDSQLALPEALHWKCLDGTGIPTDMLESTSHPDPIHWILFRVRS